MPRLLVRDACIVNADGRRRGDILVEDGRIAAVGGSLSPEGARVLEVGGRPVLPGGVDPHVHFALETPAGVSSDDFFSGSRAALAGGTTTVIDFVTPEREQNLLQAFEIRRRAAAASCCDYGLHMGITRATPETAGQMRRLVDAYGVTSFKTYLAYPETIGIADDEFLAVLETAARLEALVTVHAEHGPAVEYLRRRLRAEGKRAPRFHPRSRPPEVEAEAVNRAILLARLAGSAIYLVHVSTAPASAAIRAARRSGQRVFGETCPQYLALDESEYRRGRDRALACLFSPPLRKRAHQHALWRALTDGSLQTVATDHCPFNRFDPGDPREDDFTLLPNGCGGVEYRLSLLYTLGVVPGRFGLERLVELTAAAPAWIFGLFPRKGTIRPGADADLVVWDETVSWTASAARQWQRCDHSLYEGMTLQGRPHAVVAGGEVVFADGSLTVRRGRGRYLSRGRAGSD